MPRDRTPSCFRYGRLSSRGKAAAAAATYRRSRRYLAPWSPLTRMLAVKELGAEVAGDGDARGDERSHGLDALAVRLVLQRKLIST